MDTVTEWERVRFLMQLQEHTKGDTQSFGNVYDIGKAVGLTEDQSRIVANHLSDRGWLRFNQNTGGGLVMITAVGALEVERLTQPAWKRFLTNETVIVAIIAAVVSSIITALTTALVGKLL